ncbi:hypothetical protein [Actinomadura parmotrematis]|uniref:Uncharacterized protein n=1 Tax=Actinomadura parmotrematis TaxID=2864039 RepID=A0ABS7FN15_9ACTN|nr:hypothetical protein [Actinomadura parmotrematis]MBW8481380.1 hypothetical protein [Actinomadura parmotrematis]
MPSKSKKSRPGTDRPISITAVVDCVGALASRSLHGNLYLYDTNRAAGSTGLGTEELRTRVRAGDRLLWNVISLECETYAAIDAIVVDPEVCEPERHTYPGTDITYWTATVKPGAPDVAHYQVRLRLGTRTEPITTTLRPALVG